jgi:hypothetical protein
LGRKLGVARISSEWWGFAVVDSFEKWGEIEARERDKLVGE